MGPLWDNFETFFGNLKTSWDFLGTILGPFWDNVGPSFLGSGLQNIYSLEYMQYYCKNKKARPGQTRPGQANPGHGGRPAGRWSFGWPAAGRRLASRPSPGRWPAVCQARPDQAGHQANKDSQFQIPVFSNNVLLFLLKTLARDRRTLRVCACGWGSPGRLQDFMQGLCKIFSRNSPFVGDKMRAQIHPKITPKSTKMASKRVRRPLG